MGTVEAADPRGFIGRARKTEMRLAMNAMLYLLRTGCPWRYLPRDGFPPRSTVYNIFRKLKKDGVWDVIWAHLHIELREKLGREASPTAGVMDDLACSGRARPLTEDGRRRLARRCQARPV